ncbi:MAG: hypothetical protein MUO40_06240 [Anaerolineaceae bacterium]|nr:hypothetical protein [Anaerolineaceae bacterium]
MENTPEVVADIPVEPELLDGKPPKKKMSKTTLIIIIVAAVLLLCCCITLIVVIVGFIPTFDGYGFMDFARLLPVTGLV